VDAPAAGEPRKNSPACAAQFHVFRPVAIGDQCAVKVQEKPDAICGPNLLGDLIPAIEKMRNTASSLSHNE
jgi:hypothetical protein